jgi:hypothetical protein
MFALDHALKASHVCPTFRLWPTRLVFSSIFFFQNGNKANSLTCSLIITVVIIIINIIIILVIIIIIIIIILSVCCALSETGYLAVDAAY